VAEKVKGSGPFISTGGLAVTAVLLLAAALVAVIIGGALRPRPKPSETPAVPPEVPAALSADAPPPKGPSPAKEISRQAAERAGLEVRPAAWWSKLGSTGVVRCGLCPRGCVLHPGQRGYCRARANYGGEMFTLVYGSPVAANSRDPIEKKPLYHVLPGTRVTSIATAGCDLSCLFCQNWEISQAYPEQTPFERLSPEQVVAAAKRAGSSAVAYTYTEPTVFYEYMLDTAKLARARGLKNGMHTCGYINPEPLRELLKYMDAVNVDLKSFNPEFYRKMNALAELQPVLDTLKTIRQAGVWLEITNLIIPGQNDDPKEIRAMCRWIKDNLGDDVPLHFSRFMPAFRLQNLPPTPVEKLEEAYTIAKDEGLKYVYIGNVPGNSRENTYCPNCGKLVIERLGYMVRPAGIKSGKCAYCEYAISGVWENRPR